jgi:transposase InsO family protein
MDGNDWEQMNERELEAWRARIALIETLLDETIGEAERDEIRRAYQREHGITDRTIRNYLKRYREAGAGGLRFDRYRHTARSPRIHDTALANRILELIEERPRRTVPQLRRLLSGDPEFAQAIVAVSDRTVYRFLAEHGLTHKHRAAKAAEDGRRHFQHFQATASMQLVQGDGRDGIWLPDGASGRMKKTYLFAWVDDYSRRILSAKYFFDEKLPRMEDTSRTMILRWGIPEKLYLDNGAVYIAAQFAFILSELGIRKIHHPPYQAWCKGKVEAVMKTIKLDFQAEAQQAGFQTLDELNSALWAWIDVEYNRRNHSSTGEAPVARFASGLPAQHRRVENLEWFEALFLLRERRTVSKYGLIKLAGNQYRTQVHHGQVIEIRFNAFDMRTVWRFEDGRCVETLVPHKFANDRLPRLSEEHSAAPAKVSASASTWFAGLRERHAQLRREADVPRYDKLKGDDSP